MRQPKPQSPDKTQSRLPKKKEQKPIQTKIPKEPETFSEDELDKLLPLQLQTLTPEKEKSLAPTKPPTPPSITETNRTRSPTKPQPLKPKQKTTPPVPPTPSPPALPQPQQQANTSKPQPKPPSPPQPPVSQQQPIPPQQAPAPPVSSVPVRSTPPVVARNGEPVRQPKPQSPDTLHRPQAPQQNEQRSMQQQPSPLQQAMQNNNRTQASPQQMPPQPSRIMDDIAPTAAQPTNPTGAPMNLPTGSGPSLPQPKPPSPPQPPVSQQQPIPPQQAPAPPVSSVPAPSASSQSGPPLPSFAAPQPQQDTPEALLGLDNPGSTPPPNDTSAQATGDEEKSSKKTYVLLAGVILLIVGAFILVYLLFLSNNPSSQSPPPLPTTPATTTDTPQTGDTNQPAPDPTTEAPEGTTPSTDENPEDTTPTDPDDDETALPEPPDIPPPSAIPTSIQPPAPLIQIPDMVTLSYSIESPTFNQIQQAFESIKGQDFPPNSITYIPIRLNQPHENGSLQFLTADLFIQALGIDVPEEFLHSIEPTFMLYAYAPGTEELEECDKANLRSETCPGVRLGLVFEQRAKLGENAVSLPNLITNWLGSDITTMAPLILDEAIFPSTISFENVQYEEVPHSISYINLPHPATTLNFATIKKYLVIGTSKNSTITMLDAILEQEERTNAAGA
ncbi:MAG: hypothetical protein F4X82_02460 [Candidatus Spechtbacteria bacterium SB0662_bin_43]|uniref:Uncharacterized protein n=1 Tax=Candidatus Spechtbacteria bacterium SB0662_bin_43 TaxID=2604897 RepID=A0A845DEE2_9BACT|nr:hypothetical protein [Candidatus Spechtbacteria bacterium SB0662_bin_43]